MAQLSPDQVKPEDVLSFWFDPNLPQADEEASDAFWFSRMQGGMDQEIVNRFADVTTAAAQARLDHWAGTSGGRLALILTLDQFPRSLWRDTPAAYGQDIKATRLAIGGLGNGHYDALRWGWERNFYIIAMTHCEGPDHLARMDRALELAQAIPEFMPPQLRETAKGAEAQVRRVREIIERFGRHPHRNTILGRISTPEEEAYIATGDFPHLAKRDDPEGA